MKSLSEFLSGRLSRREGLKLSGMALGSLALGGRAAASCDPPTKPCYPTLIERQKYDYFDNLETMDYTHRIPPPLLPNEMRITFMGSTIPPARRSQMFMSVFVEVGGGPNGTAKDQFVFDCGTGVTANYGSMGIGYDKMDKVFINHLHADHMSDLATIYCFGPSGDRKSPQYVWGPSNSGVRNPDPGRPYYDDGLNAYCRYLREMCRWHTESFSFESTGRTGYVPPTKESWGLPHDPVPVGNDAPDDGYALVPIELNWGETGIAYQNAATGVTVTHFPVIHTRRGSIGYKLEWNGLSMIYTADTKPETTSVELAKNGGAGVDVFIHEMVPPPDVWAMDILQLNGPGSGPVWEETVNNVKTVQDSSHTPQGAFGYLLSLIEPRPRLAIATHFPTSNDSVACALRSVRRHCHDILENGDKLTWSFDRMVIRVFAGDPKPPILQRQAVTNDYGYGPFPKLLFPGDPQTPKYHKADGTADPFAQLDLSTWIPPGPDTYCDDGY